MSTAIRRFGLVAVSVVAGVLGLGSAAAHAATTSHASTSGSASTITSLSTDDEAKILGSTAIRPMIICDPSCTV
jgi:hypothetical protein